MTDWQSRPPDLTPLNSSVWLYVKDKVIVPTLPAILEELRAMITEATATLDVDMIHRIGEEIFYKWDIRHVTRGNHIEHL
jgi:hypothetical protein